MPVSRAYWKGYLKLSFVSCPIAFYPASAAERLSFRQINRRTGHRLRHKLVDSVTGVHRRQAQAGRTDRAAHRGHAARSLRQTVYRYGGVFFRRQRAAKAEVINDISRASQRCSGSCSGIIRTFWAPGSRLSNLSLSR